MKTQIDDLFKTVIEDVLPVVYLVMFTKFQYQL